MSDKMGAIIAFVAGAAIGSIVTWKLVEKKYKVLADEEIESVREVYKRKLDEKQKEKTEEKEENPLCPIEDYRSEIRMLYGGRAAEVRLKGSVEAATAGASQDIKQATNIASQYVSIADGIDYSAFGKYGVDKIMTLTTKLLSEIWKEAQKSIDDHWVYVEAVAQELIKNETVSKEKFLEIVKSV